MIPLIAGILLFVSFGSLYYFNLSFLAPLYTHFDLFGMDSLPFLRTIYNYYPFPELHPASKVLYYLLPMFSAALPVSIEHAVRIELAVIGGGNVALAFFVLRAWLRNSRTAALFAAAFGLVFSNLVFFSVPETYLVSDSMILVYTLVLVCYHDNMTLRRYLILSALAGVAAANNLPLASLMVPHSCILWKERRSMQHILAPGLTGTAVMIMVFLGINSVFPDHFYFAKLLEYKNRWGTVSNFADIANWFRVIETFFLVSVIAPGKSLSADVYRVASYFACFGKIALLVIYGYTLGNVWGHLIKKRDKVIEGLLLWLLLMTLAYIYFDPGESYIYSSQVLLPVCLILAKIFETSRLRFKYSYAAVVVVLVGCNNLFCLYHPCELNDLSPRQPVMGKAFIGNRVRASRESAGLTVQQLAGKTGIDPARLVSCEKGEKEMPMDDLNTISRALQQPLPSLCSGIPGR